MTFFYWYCHYFGYFNDIWLIWVQSLGFRYLNKLLLLIYYYLFLPSYLYVVTLDSHIKDLLIEALSKGHIGIKQVCSSLIKCATVSYNRQTSNSLTTDQSLTRVYFYYIFFNN